MTGNQIVDQITELRITGNIIPENWYKAITKLNGKPYLNAIIILSDLVYWYRASEVRDEETGMLIGYRQKFRGDLLRRSYQQLADKFGLSKRDVINAIVSLEKDGLIRRVFRTVAVGNNVRSTVMNNVLYIELCAEKLREITYPDAYHSGVYEEEDIIESENEDNTAKKEEKEEHRESIPPLPPGKEGGSHSEKGEAPTQKRERLPPKKEGGSHPKKREAPTQKSGTYKEITKEINKYIYNTNLITSNQNNNKLRPKHKDNSFTDSEKTNWFECQRKFRRQISYDELSWDLQEDHGQKKKLDELVEAAVELLCLNDDAVVWAARQSRPAGLVKARVNKLTMEHMRYILQCLDQNRKQVKNIKGYMVSMLFNAPATMTAYTENLFTAREGGA